MRRPSVDIQVKFYADRPGNPSVGELNTRRVAEHSDFFTYREHYISETVQDIVSINHYYSKLSIGTKIGDFEWPWTA